VQSAGSRTVAWPALLETTTLPTAGEYVFNDEGVLLFEVDSVVTGDATSYAFSTTGGAGSDHTITRTGGTSFVTLGFTAGNLIYVSSPEDAGNAKAYKISAVTSTIITIDQTYSVITSVNATDTTAKVQMLVVIDHTQAGVTVADDDIIADIGLTIRSADQADYSIIRVVSESVLHVKHVNSGDEVTDTTITGMTCEIVVADELEDVSYTIEDTLSGGEIVGDVLVSYAARRKDHLDEFQEVTAATVSDVAGVAVPGNPLGLAALTAVGNTTVPVLLLQVGDDTVAGWTAALETLKTDQVYSLAPLTQDDEILGLFQTHVTLESAAETKRERILWQSKRFETQDTRWTMDDSESATYFNDGTAESLEVTTTSGLVALGVRAGDTFTGTISGFLPDDGFTSEELTGRVTKVEESGGVTTLTVLASDSHPETTASGVVLTALVIKSKVKSTVQLRNEIAAYPATILNRRIRNLYPDRVLITFDDETNPNDTSVGLYGGGEVTDYEVGGWLMAAAAAALRSGFSASTPLTGKSMTGFQRLVNAVGTSTTHLDVILDAGNYLLAQPAGDNGGVQAVRAVTTDVSTLNNLEEAVTAQFDNFARKLRKQVRPTLGTVVLDESFFDLFSTIQSAVVTDVLRKKEMRKLALVELKEDPARADSFLATYEGTPFYSAAGGEVFVIAL
jgi:hypothetical protein